MERLHNIKVKIFDRDHLRKQLAVWRFKDKKIVFTNGCFDILHLGHIEYLAKARHLGGVLIVGLNSDESIRRIKGDGRPLNDEHARAMVLASLSFVDAVVIFNEDTPYELIRIVQPDILVKGKDYHEHEVVGRDIVKARGGKVSTIELTEGYSTTGIIEKISGLKK